MKVLFVSSEVAPYSKTGGLGDVGGALPAALAAEGHTVWVVSPRYRGIQAPVKTLDRRLTLRFPFGAQSVGLAVGEAGPRHQLVFLEHDAYFGRDGIYGDAQGEFSDNHRRFALLSLGALAAAQALEVEPDVIHLNDWPTALAAPALTRGFAQTALARARSVFTIHNLAYQGVFPKSAMGELGLPWDLFTPEGLELYDQVSFLKAGVSASQVVTTVSPTYAQEIQTSAYGEGLDGFMRANAAKLTGILNGVDYREWNPETDPHLAARYSASDLSGKAACKRALREAFQLRLPEGGVDKPIAAMVVRLAAQKGVDLVLAALPALVADGWQLVVIGNGDPALEEELRAAALHHPGQVGVFIGFQPVLAHRAEAGADFFLMPSRYEPCGLNQMYSLRYGTVPVVRATGGLEDTVVDLSLLHGDGFKFHDFVPEALRGAMGRALELYRDPVALGAAQRRGMAQVFSWQRAAREYVSVYRRKAL